MDNCPAEVTTVLKNFVPSSIVDLRAVFSFEAVEFKENSQSKITGATGISVLIWILLVASNSGEPSSVLYTMAVLTLASKLTSPSVFNSKSKSVLANLKQTPVEADSNANLKLNLDWDEASVDDKGYWNRIPWFAAESFEIGSSSRVLNDSMTIPSLKSNPAKAVLLSNLILIWSTLYNSSSNLKKFLVFWAKDFSNRSNLISVSTLLTFKETGVYSSELSSVLSPGSILTLRA